MTITLTPEQQAWIDAHVARGEYASAEHAARSLIDAAILDVKSLDEDDLAWAKPFVDEALAEVERGDVMSFDEYQTDMRAFLETLK